MCRIYACLALVDGFLVPTSHYPKIVKDHVEMAKDINFFLAYFWGRLSFEMMMKSIKERDVEQLATTCVPVQGLLYALQLVILQAASNSDGGPIADVGQRSSVPFNIVNVKRLDGIARLLLVDPIICPYLELEHEEDLTWEDDSEDPTVDNIKRGVKARIIRPRKGQNLPPSQPTRSINQHYSSGPASGLTGTCTLATLSCLLDFKLGAMDDRIIKGVTAWISQNPNILVESARYSAKDAAADKQATEPPPHVSSLNVRNVPQRAAAGKNVLDPDNVENTIDEILSSIQPTQMRFET
ncbi:hypothetical protein CARUB_v10018425mg [Capsella rubella]|uniref:DUF1985 domain-containing protein n=1 Tax=Capsella rubella TaxID=81985 RepID=R0FRB1_9BRAS|nr:hypothetical protein CARUB_v10018425mg [Capsella rubella]